VSKYKTNDPSRYTLDEAIAMILLNIFFFTPGHWLAAFALFRFFDILKPLGIKKMEVLPGVADSLKNIIDDLLAAAYTFLVIIAYDLYF
jgi:phosphatidylglycerophosphatase A